ncbi:hypothetical protein J6590_002665 [Homalodisca vitripennis]|nr:hypothetical protein J6590_002665 [Homalodisca vitripennis]
MRLDRDGETDMVMRVMRWMESVSGVVMEILVLVMTSNTPSTRKHNGPYRVASLTTHNTPGTLLLGLTCEQSTIESVVLSTEIIWTILQQMHCNI